MSTQKYREMLLDFLYTVAKIETDEDFYLIYETDPYDVYDFLHTGLLPINWLDLFFIYIDQAIDESSVSKRYAYDMLAFLLGRMYDDRRDLSKIDMDYFNKSVLWNPGEQAPPENNASGDDNSSPAPPKKRRKRGRPRKVKTPDNLDEIARKIFARAFSKTLSENSIKMPALNDTIQGVLANHSVKFDANRRKIILYDGENSFVIDHKVPDDIDVVCT